MCTVVTAINKQEQEMKEIDEKDATDGYVACTPIPDVLGYNSCIGCAFNDEHTNGCVPSRGKASAQCMSVKMRKMLSSSPTGSLPCHINSPRSDDLCSR